MENPEEVMQALDEFQKLRPSEIPKELEDYLCWVAKTGDPVYQWGLVKALFREKLMRVISDFYESCPSLDLTPCPNVEPFNYDAMKRTLIDRLENFVNAPFTVQRICELLTTPRKEYNRVDKFMRAIEKNILVVSTREPGANGRRSENGDNLVNGSLDDENSHHEQSSNEVDMENWVKDCTVNTAVALRNEEADSLENGLKDRLETQISLADPTASSFVVSSSSDFSPVTPTVVPQIPSQEEVAVQNLHEAAAANVAAAAAAAIIGDVSDAIMNEDTSSQPSLELESDESDSNDSKKLQTTFQHQDFTLEEEKLHKEYSEGAPEEKSSQNLEVTDASDKDCEQPIESSYASENDGASGCLNRTYEIDNSEVEPADSSETEQVLLTEAQSSETSELETNALVDSFAPVEGNLNVKDGIEENIGADSSEAQSKEFCDSLAKEDIKIEPPVENISSVTESIEPPICEPVEQVATEPVVTASTELIKPIVEEPPVETTDPSATSSKPDDAELTIKESTEEESKPTNSVVPDPIPIVEEPKEGEPSSSSKDWETSVPQAQEVNETTEAAAKNGRSESPELKQQQDNSNMVVTGCDEALTAKAATESMDVDNSEAAAGQQQDEPMEQETNEAMSS